jgi:hypothetical protein
MQFICKDASTAHCAKTRIIKCMVILNIFYREAERNILKGPSEQIRRTESDNNGQSGLRTLAVLGLKFFFLRIPSLIFPIRNLFPFFLSCYLQPKPKAFYI